MGLLQTLHNLLGPQGTINTGLARGMQTPLFNLGMGLLNSAQPFSNPGQDIQQAMAAGQQYGLNSQLNPLRVQQAQQQTQQGQMGLDYQRAMNNLIMSRLQGQQASPPGLLSQPSAPAGLLNTSTARPTQQPSWLAAPSLSDIQALPVGGLPADISTLMAIRGGKAPAEAANDARAAQIAQAKQKYDPIVQQLAAITQSDNPVRDINASPLLKATWAHYAQQRGLNPATDLNKTNAYQVFGDLANQYRAQLGETAAAPPVPLTENGINPITNKYEAGAPEKIVGRTGIPINVLPQDAINQTPYSPFVATASQMNGPVGDLDAALTTLGVNIPGGRGGQLYLAKLRNLIAANPGVPPEQIAQQVKTGQLDFNGQKRSTGQLSQVLASTNAFSLQMEKNLDSLSTVEGQVDKTGIPVLNRAFAAFQRNITGGKDIAKYTAYFNAVTSEYAKIISGGTGVAAPNEQDMNEARRVISQAYTSGGLQGLREALTTEANNKRASYQEGLNAAARTSTASTTPAANVAPKSKRLTYDAATGTFK